jgi:hypothetical protein
VGAPGGWNIGGEKYVQWIHGTNKVLLVSENSTMCKDYEAVIDEIKIFGRIKSCIRAM